jgi:hypothetical protein
MVLNGLEFAGTKWRDPADHGKILEKVRFL